MMTIRTTPELDAELDAAKGRFTRTAVILHLIRHGLDTLTAKKIQAGLEKSGAAVAGGRKGGPGRGHKTAENKAKAKKVKVVENKS